MHAVFWYFLCNCVVIFPGISYLIFVCIKIIIIHVLKNFVLIVRTKIFLVPHFAFLFIASVKSLIVLLLPMQFVAVSSKLPDFLWMAFSFLQMSITYMCTHSVNVLLLSFYTAYRKRFFCLQWNLKLSAYHVFSFLWFVLFLNNLKVLHLNIIML